MIDELVIKIGGLVFLQNILAIVKINVTRFIIKTQFSNSEIPLSAWFSWNFIQTLNYSKFLGLGLIAVFTLVTFPLGVWIGSFKLGLALPIVNAVGLVTLMITDPLNLIVVNRTLNEMNPSSRTGLGIVLLEVGYCILILAWYFIYTANQVI